MDITYWSIPSSSRMEGDGVKGVDSVDRHFSLLQVSLY